jgi:hypothetical protein
VVLRRAIRLTMVLFSNYSYSNQRNQQQQQFDPFGNPIKDPMSGDFSSNSGSGGNNNPLAHLNESVNSLDPLNAMEKTLNDQVMNQKEKKTKRKKLNEKNVLNRCHTLLTRLTHPTVVTITIR